MGSNIHQHVGVVIVDHGSRLPAANDTLECMAALLREHGDYAIVEAAHMELAEPSITAAVAKCADELGISPELVAPRKELSAAILSGNTDSRVFQGWRRPLIGERLLQLL